MTEPIATLCDLVQARARSHPNRGYGFLGDGTTVSDRVSYADLDRTARSIAIAMQRMGLRRGDRAVLAFPYGLDFVRAFWACFYAGIIAVPAPPPVPARLERTVARLRAITTDCDPGALLTSSAMLPGARAALATCWSGDATKVLLTDEVTDDPSEWKPAPAKGSDVAMLQYTSGSTRDPRGVVLTHANLLHNLSMLRQFHLEQEDLVMVHWLPLYHDMGLIRGVMSSLEMGGDCFMMSPFHFVQAPGKWLRALTALGATTTGAPNFGYELCVRKIGDAELDAIDLRRLRLAFCSSEPIRAQTVARFVERFGPRGLGAGVFRPAYGLAEATVMVAGEVGSCARTHQLDAAALRADRVVALDGGRELVSCGRPLGGQEVVIVDDDGRHCGPDRIGEIWIRGPSVASGYWQKPSESIATFGGRLADGDGPFLRTGDLGFSIEGELCVTGRKKDLVIVRGENHYPQEIEASVEAASPLVRAGSSAVFGIEHAGSEAVVVVAECASATVPLAEVADAIHRAVAAGHDIPLAAICLVSAGETPKTASGKVQRARARRMYLDGGFVPLHHWVREETS